MSYESELQAIVSRFDSQSTVPTILWDGLNAPNAGTPNVDPADYGAAIWARLTVATVPRAVAPVAGVTRPGPVGLGTDAPTYREGLIVVQHFAPRGAAMDGLLTYVDETRATFHRARFGNVVCRDTDSPDIVGADADSEWFQVNTTTPYYVLEIFEDAVAADRVVETYAQTAHAITVGKAAALTSSGVAQAQADSADTLAIGVVSRVRTVDKLDVTHEGRVTVTAHSYGTVGTRLYLSQATAGLLTTTAPLSGLKQEVARVWDANTLLVRPQPAESL